MGGDSVIQARCAAPQPALVPLAWCPLQPPPLAVAIGSGEPDQPILLLLDRQDPALTMASPGLEAVLDPAERARGQRFLRQEDRQRHLLGRVALRLALGAWLGSDPAALRFGCGPHGKPELVSGGPDAPHFNLAHSGDLILLALHRCWSVGVDLERRRPDLDWLPIARRTLPTADLVALQSLPLEQQADGFLQAWCRLEARLKASGEGLAGLERLQRGIQERRTAIGLRDVLVPPDYRAAVALQAPAPSP